MTEERIRLREEVQEQIRSLKELAVRALGRAALHALGFLRSGPLASRMIGSAPAAAPFFCCGLPFQPAPHSAAPWFP